MTECLGNIQLFINVESMWSLLMNSLMLNSIFLFVISYFRVSFVFVCYLLNQYDNDIFYLILHNYYKTTNHLFIHFRLISISQNIHIKKIVCMIW